MSAVAEQVSFRPRTFHRSDAAILAGAALSSLAVVWLFFHLVGLSGPAGFGVLWYATFAGIYWVVVRDTEGRLAAADRLASLVIASVAVALLIPLVLIVAFVTAKGIGAVTLNFFTKTELGIGPLDPATRGGALHAIVGTLEEVGLATLVSVPLGILTALFLNEVGGRWARPVRMFVDAMSGVPSIVAGLFIYAVWVVGLGRGFSGLAAAFAMSILMLPTVTRTVEEVLRLVPDGLREASLALGATEWRTTANVVLPTARSGMVTAVILGVARAIGETAPLIMTAFGASLLNLNPVKGAQDNLPLYIYKNIRSPLPAQLQRAWTGALVLIALVLTLFVLARVVGRSRLGKGARA